jgi:hypothetical protein
MLEKKVFFFVCLFPYYTAVILIPFFLLTTLACISKFLYFSFGLSCFFTFAEPHSTINYLVKYLSAFNVTLNILFNFKAQCLSISWKVYTNAFINIIER